MKTIEVISIPVSNQETAKAFYLKLGFEVIAESPYGNGSHWIQLGIPDQVTSITLVNRWPLKAMPAGSLQGLFLETDDLDREVKELKMKGVDILRVDHSPLGKLAWLTDPDGNGITLHEHISMEE